MSKVLRMAEAARLLGVSLSTLWRWERSGDFPKRIRLGVRTVGIREDELMAWIEGRQRPGMDPARTPKNRLPQIAPAPIETEAPKLPKRKTRARKRVRASAKAADVGARA
jgi:prophage regulatory protein